MKILLLTLCLSCVLASAKKPNVVLLFADDWGRHASAYAKLDGAGTLNDFVQTPHFDRIASEGVIFRNAFVSSPSCTPCRSALVSGMHFWQTRSGSILHSQWDFSLPAFPLILQENGYHIGLSYKGWGPGKPTEAPFGGKKAHYQRAGWDFRGFSQKVTNARGAGEAAKEKLYQEVRLNFSDFLADRKEGEPFFYLFGPPNTHRPWTKGSGKALWGIDPDSFKGKMPAFLPDVAAVREDFSDYLGEVQAVDGGIGAIIDVLKKSGELENTLIIISGDHGAPGFPHGKVNLYDFGTRVPLVIRFGKNIENGRVIDRLTSLIDLAPTILEAAEIEIPAEMTGESLLPILVGKKSGESIDEAVFTGRERHVPIARKGNLPYPQRAIRTKDYLFIINFEPDRWPVGEPRGISETSAPSEKELLTQSRITLADTDAGPTKAWIILHHNDETWKKYYERTFGKRPRHELYDLRKDPQQIDNLAGKPEVADIEDGLKERLMVELIRTKDPRVTGDRLYFETAPMTNP